MQRVISAHTTMTEEVSYLLWKIDNFLEVLSLSSINGPDIIMPTQPVTVWKTNISSSKLDEMITKHIFRAELLTLPKFEKTFQIKYQLLFQNEEGTILKEYNETGHLINSSYTIRQTFAYWDSYTKVGLDISELLVKGALTLKCCFSVIGSSTEIDITTEASSENNLKCLLDNFRALHSSKTLSDFTIVVKDKELPVHKCILSSRSPVFAAMFQIDTLETIDNKLIVEDFDFNIMEALTVYLYTGQLSALCAEDYFQLYAASDKYGVETLKKECAQKLINFITVDNVCAVYALGHYHSDPVLVSAAKCYLCRHVSPILTSEGWRKLTSENQQLATEMLKVAGIL